MRHGKNVVIVISFEDYHKSNGHDVNLVDFLRKSPLQESNLDLD